jgi:hypothetical protein
VFVSEGGSANKAQGSHQPQRHSASTSSTCSLQAIAKLPDENGATAYGAVPGLSIPRRRAPEAAAAAVAGEGFDSLRYH